MSHFIVTVLIPKDTKNIQAKVADLLAPYDERLEVEPYIYKTRDRLLAEKEEVTREVNSADCRDHLRHYNGGIEQMSLAEFARSYYGKEVDKEENVLTTFSKNSKWDWYEIGGRWASEVEGNTCAVSKLPKDFSTFAIVTPDGEWHEKGEMGWWAIVINEKDKTGWQLEQAVLFEAYNDCLAVVVDCHI